MSFKDTWIDKVDDVDYVNAKDINDIAHGVIALENDNAENEEENKIKWEEQENENNSLKNENNSLKNAIASLNYAQSLLANAIVGNKTGEIVAITDTSPVAHEMGVNVSGVVDVSTVKLKKLGKNLISYPYISPTSSITNGITFTTNEDRSITISGVATANAYYTLYKGYFGSKNMVGNANGGTNGDYAFSPFINYNPNNTNVSVYIANRMDFSTPVTIYPQVEKGTIVTAYEPYIEPIEYPVSADGTVEGVISIYPTTMFMTDTAGAIINVEYNKDATKVINELTTRIAALEDAVLN